MLKRYLAILAVALSLGGCQVLDLVNAATTGFTNPVKTVNIYQVKNVYGAAVQAEISYREYCYQTSFEDLMKDAVRKPICQYRRRVITAFQKARPTARAAIDKAEIFIRDNPRLSAASLIQPAWEAVTKLRALIPTP